MTWELYWLEDGTLDLARIYKDVYKIEPNVAVIDFFKMANSLRPIKSRQVAALALAMAGSISGSITCDQKD
jgi:hypothetical protein